jgi:uncharacterized protein
MQDSRAQPWWKFGHVWLVIAGPAIVIVAGFFTLYLAIRTPDPVISTEAQRRLAEVSRPDADGAAAASSLAPAVQARNHAATGVPAGPARP